MTGNALAVRDLTLLQTRNSSTRLFDTLCYLSECFYVFFGVNVQTVFSSGVDSSVMASGGPVMNGDISRSPSQSGTLEETLQQMNILIQENRDLKEALRQTNLTMKERFEGLTAWREKQREERDFLESRLAEARGRMEALTHQNQDLSKKLEEAGRAGGAPGGWQATSSNQSTEVEALRAQVARLQAEKNDLVAMNSELQLKAEQDSRDDSFIEIIKVSDGGVSGVNDVHGTERSMTASRLDSEELTVSQLLQSLRNETQRADRLQEELRVSAARIRELEERKSDVEESTQMTETKEDSEEEEKAASEVENLKSQMMTLFKELQQAQSKLDEAESMKKNLQDSTAFTFTVKESGHCVALDQQCLGNLELSVQRLRETWEVELKEGERYEAGIILKAGGG
ncbi:optineurin isoform X1, partial [Lates japonicus]